MKEKTFSKTALFSLLIPFLYVLIVLMGFFLVKIGFGALFGVLVFSSYAIGAVSILLGIRGIMLIRKYGEKYKGMWAAITGVILGTVLIIFILYFMQIISTGISLMR